MFAFIPFSIKTLPLTMIRVYVYHDAPRLFSAQDDKENIWLVLWADEHHHDGHAGYEGQDDWLAVQVSDARLKKIENGEIDLHDAFRHAENGEGIYIESPWPGGHDFFKIVKLEELESDLFHKPGVRLLLEETDT